MFIRFLPLLAYLLFEGNGAPSGGNAGGEPAGNSGASGDGGGQGGSPTPPAGGNADPAPAPAEGPMVPKARFDEALGKLRQYEDAERRRADDEAAKRGEFDKVKSKLEGENTGLKATLTEVALRNAFYTAASGKATNLRLAYMAAKDAGLLDGLSVEIKLDSHEATVAGEIGKIVDETLKANPELKAGARSFGEPASGQPPSGGIDPDKLTPIEKMRQGYAASRSGR